MWQGSLCQRLRLQGTDSARLVLPVSGPSCSASSWTCSARFARQWAPSPHLSLTHSLDLLPAWTCQWSLLLLPMVQAACWLRSSPLVASLRKRPRLAWLQTLKPVPLSALERLLPPSVQKLYSTCRALS